MALTRDITVTIPIPTLEGIAAAGLVVNAIIVEHNMLSGCTLILWSFYPKHVFKAIYNIVWGIPKSICLGFVRCLGFGRKGVGQNTYASRYQSRYYKDYIPEDSLFASYQSYGAIGDDHDYYFGPADADTRQEKLGLLWQAFSWALFIRGIKLVMKRSAT